MQCTHLRFRVSYRYSGGLASDGDGGFRCSEHAIYPGCGIFYALYACRMKAFKGLCVCVCVCVCIVCMCACV